MLRRGIRFSFSTCARLRIIARKAYKLPNYGEKCKFSRLHFEIFEFYQCPEKLETKFLVYRRIAVSLSPFQM